MQSPQHKTQRSFNSILPSIKKQSTERKTTYELNNEGCKCELCQKIIINENMKIMAEEIHDMESEGFTKDRPKEHFIPLIEQIVNKWKYKRTLRFCLPQILLYEHGHPVAIVQKKKQTSSIIINKSKSRLHFFQIQNFFLTSFISHSPTKKSRSSKTQAISKPYLNECIIFAKYENNVYRMMTYKQIQDMFRSKNKAMKDGLMYLQTLVGGDGFKSITIIVKLDEIDTNEQMKTLFQRAKAEVKIITGEIKLIDVQYFQENQQIQFQNQLKNYDMNRYLLYLSYKFILISSKMNPQIMKHSIFKYAVVDKKVFLFDLRVKQFGSGVKYWSSNVLQALQIKIQKTMSLMELEKGEKQDRYKVFENQLSSKARQLSDWLNASTQQEWDQMKIIRKRLQKLQQQKKSLQKSQKQQEMRKSFKMRNIQSKRKKQKNDVKIEYSFNF